MADLPHFSDVEGFEWDRANIQKNWQRHHVAFYECEEVFFHEPLVVAPNPTHSVAEARYFAYGRTVRGRLLTVVFTVRGKKFRMISARDMSWRERKVYESKAQADS